MQCSIRSSPALRPAASRGVRKLARATVWEYTPADLRNIAAWLAAPLAPPAPPADEADEASLLGLDVPDVEDWDPQDPLPDHEFPDVEEWDPQDIQDPLPEDALPDAELWEGLPELPELPAEPAPAPVKFYAACKRTMITTINADEMVRVRPLEGPLAGKKRYIEGVVHLFPDCYRSKSRNLTPVEVVSDHVRTCSNCQTIAFLTLRGFNV